ncbi:YicC/YloC family endoribonuclease [Candidatus Pantoea edessiphila]|uniref:YicC family protein n=1 Tax=Candidatus Pantoea edessiphila TaxID=2044610 RepID=A0A2P5SVM1_9GAMM|nr:YicC/YloC family endoribonuclease [Candidatus Pantoea edessiphila]PPI86362.1 YicC family protein [Candidatus Pantoea edessiphila]
MIKSMTAYASYKTTSYWGVINWEFRSVNQRYLEIYIHLPEYIRKLEVKIKKSIRQRLIRGRIEGTLSIEFNCTYNNKLNINQELVKQIIDATRWIKIQNNVNGVINLLEILRWPGVISASEQYNVIIDSEILNAMNQAINNLIQTRENEGNELKLLIEERLYSIKNEINKIRLYIPEVLKLQHKRIFDKLKHIKLQLEHCRLEQELVMIAQRIDITEELDRLDTHIKEIFNILKMQGAVGKRLDFMMQELSRESNTLLSKSISSEITICVIELKVLIEQIREQIQNIE